jgi:hypothetical protein
MTPPSSPRDWQPIETAPNRGKVITCFKGQFEWQFFIDFAYGDLTGQNTNHAAPTHWMPLPAPPTDGAA